MTDRESVEAIHAILTGTVTTCLDAGYSPTEVAEAFNTFRFTPHQVDAEEEFGVPVDSYAEH